MRSAPRAQIQKTEEDPGFQGLSRRFGMQTLSSKGGASSSRPRHSGSSLPPCFLVSLRRLPILPGTTPHSKIAATFSQQTRRHFLPGTKTPLPVRQIFATNRGPRVAGRSRGFGTRTTLNSSSRGSNFAQAPGNPFYRKEDTWQQQQRRHLNRQSRVSFHENTRC